MRLEAAGLSDVGTQRDNNEDCFLLDTELGLYVVCDGMGGQSAGEVASATAIETVQSTLKVFKADLENFKDTPSARAQLAKLVEHCVQQASKKVYQLARSTNGRAGMGTTLSMMVVQGHVGVIGHVGDSRIYLLRQGKLDQLTQDHSLLAELVRGGTPIEKLRNSVLGGMLTQAVGLQPNVKVDTLFVELIEGDRLLFCSDGLVGHFETPPEVQSLLVANASPREFIDFANGADHGDNVTALVINVSHSPERPVEDAQKQDEYVLAKLNSVKNVWLFKRLNLREFSQVMNRVGELELEPGVTVIEEGELSDKLYIILQGRLEVSKGGEVINVLESGQHFGEMALLSAKTRTATVKTLTVTSLLTIEKEDFTALLEENARLGTKLLWTLADVLIERLG